MLHSLVLQCIYKSTICLKSPFFSPLFCAEFNHFFNNLPKKDTRRNTFQTSDYTQKISLLFHHLFITFCGSLCYNHRNWVFVPICNILPRLHNLVKLGYHYFYKKNDSKNRQGVSYGNFQKHFRQSGDHGIRKAFPWHYGYSGYPHCCLHYL